MTLHQPLEYTQDLLRRVRNGDGAAWDSLEDKHREQLALIVRGRIPDRMRGLFDTDDIVQSAILSAFKELDSFVFRGAGSFRKWLGTLVRNKYSSLLRRHGSMKRGEDRPLSVDEISQVLSDDGSFDPEAIASRSERYTKVLVAMSNLSDVQQEAIVQRFFDSQSFEAIGTQVQISESSARRRVAEAVNSLRQELRDLSESED